MKTREIQCRLSNYRFNKHRVLSLALVGYENANSSSRFLREYRIHLTAPPRNKRIDNGRISYLGAIRRNRNTAPKILAQFSNYVRISASWPLDQILLLVSLAILDPPSRKSLESLAISLLLLLRRNDHSIDRASQKYIKIGNIPHLCHD